MLKHLGILSLATIFCFTSAQNDGSQQTFLDEFVYSEESLSEFSFFHVEDQDWTGVDPITNIGYTAHVLNMTSGNWRTEAEVGIRATWWHIIVLVIPENLNPAYASHAGLYIGGKTCEKNDGTGIPDRDDEEITIATTLGTGVGVPFAALFQIPNAPIIFTDDPTQESRTEDEIIAYTFDEHLNNTSNPELNAYVAMARAGVRTLDALTQFSQENLDTTIEKFIVSGGSKRGWTAWLTGAIAPDKVAAIIPASWDGIHLDAVFHQQYRDYGGWSFAIVDYVDNHILERLDSPEMVELLNVVDPYYYRTRLTMPKVIVTALMDEFQMPDDEQFWYDDLPAPTWLVKSPNTEHSYITGLGVAIPVMGTWFTYFLNGWEIPYLTWDYDEANGDVTVTTHGGDVFSAQMWYAYSCHDRRRDFRIASLDSPCECGPTSEEDGYEICMAFDEFWKEQPLEPNVDGTYTGHVDPLDDGRWTAFVVNIQLTSEHNNPAEPGHTFFTLGGSWDMDGPEPQPRWPITPPGILEFTSRGSIVPNTYPFPDCTLDECEAPLV